MWIRKFCSQATIALACALAMPHVAVVAWGQTPKVQNNQASFATEFESLFEQTDLSPYKPVCRCWVSQSDLNLESKRGFKTIFSALPEVDQATSPAGLLAKRGLVTSSYAKLGFGNRQTNWNRVICSKSRQLYQSRFK